MSTLIGLVRNNVWCGPLMVTVGKNSLGHKPQAFSYTVSDNRKVKRCLLAVTKSSVVRFSWTTNKEGMMKRFKSMFYFAWRHSVRSGRPKIFLGLLKDAAKIYR